MALEAEPLPHLDRQPGDAVAVSPEFGLALLERLQQGLLDLTPGRDPAGVLALVHPHVGRLQRSRRVGCLLWDQDAAP